MCRANIGVVVLKVRRGWTLPPPHKFGCTISTWGPSAEHMGKANERMHR